MNKKELIEKITQKKEFSKLPKKDVERVFDIIDDESLTDMEKIKLTREKLHKLFWSFRSKKLLSPKEKNPDWVLRKHLSSRERSPFYNVVYRRILKNDDKKLSIIDLGSGVNGFSYNYFGELGFDVNYVSVEAVGQLCDLMNSFFRKQNLNAKAYNFSLFQLEKIKEIVKKTKKPRVVFLFKVIDPLETIERDYSKKLISELIPIVDKIVLSFSTETMIKREAFRAKRKWILEFIEDRFEILDNFTVGGEKYIVFKKG